MPELLELVDRAAPVDGGSALHIVRCQDCGIDFGVEPRPGRYPTMCSWCCRSVAE